LERHTEIESLLEKKNSRTFFTTDLTDSFQKLGTIFLGENIEVQKISL
jgi:hypothetical protein